MLYRKGDNNTVECFLCNHFCKIADGKTGICQVRKNIDGTLYSLVYGKPVSMAVDPIEKKPFFNFYPSSDVFSLATYGCNFRCVFCQNWTISQRVMENLTEISPEEIVAMVKSHNAQGIAYTYTEPTIFFEYAYDIARLAKKEKLYNVFVSNGYMTEDAINEIRFYLDGANIDLKSMKDEFYRKMCGAKGVQPVIDTITIMNEKKIHVEVTNLIIPGENDDREQLKRLSQVIVDISPDIPVHFSRFHPDYRMTSRRATPLKTLETAIEIARGSGLRYVYSGNVPGHPSENTYCYNCNTVLIKRYGYTVVSYNISGNRCPECNAEINIRGGFCG